jgi:hypothetical protein
MNHGSQRIAFICETEELYIESYSFVRGTNLVRFYKSLLMSQSKVRQLARHERQQPSLRPSSTSEELSLFDFLKKIFFVRFVNMHVGSFD